MHIYIDESGSFTSAPSKVGTWCSVAAYVLPERDRKRAENALGQLKISTGVATSSEIKLKDILERDFYSFLQKLGRLDGLMFAVSIDTSSHTKQQVISHRVKQADCLVANLDRCRHESFKQAVRAEAERLSGLPDQLYVQFICQNQLVADVLRGSLLYYAQRYPSTLANFRWRCDQKHKGGTSPYQITFEHLISALLQTDSVDNPVLFLKEADYSHFEKFRFAEGAPNFLSEEYGVQVEHAFNVARVMKEDFLFVDSATVPGVQIADLLVSGLNRCLRGGFDNNQKIAQLLGALMVQAPKSQDKTAPPLRLITLGETQRCSSHVEDVVRVMIDVTKSMCTRISLPSRKTNGLNGFDRCQQ